MQHILKILTLAENAGRIGIVLGPDAQDTDLLAAHALKERLGEKAEILNAPGSLQDRWSHMFKKEHPRKETALALDIEKHPVDELRYEKDGGKLRIFLSSNAPLTKDAFIMEERFPPSDMIIALGFSREEDLSRLLQAEAPVKNTDAVINLSSSNSAPPEKALTEKIPAPQWSVDTMKLWGRALLRSYKEDGDGVFWAFLPKEDFNKTNQKDDILPALVSGMRNTMDLPPLVIVLWQNHQESDGKVHIFFSSTDKATLDRLAQAAGTSLTDGTLIVRQFANFSEAEAEARKLLKQI